jgi:hypothetical protein
MKRMFIFLTSLCVVVLLWRMATDSPKPSAVPHTTQKAKPKSAPEPALESNPSLHPLPRLVRSQLRPEETILVPMEVDQQPKETPQLGTETHVHSKDDFVFGEFVNTGASESLGLTDQAFEGQSSGTGTFASFRCLGHRGFDTITLNYDATIPPGGSLRFEVRTMLPNGKWSDWQEIERSFLNVPAQVDGKGYGWQYQFTFFAPSAASSPRVHSVTITTEVIEPGTSLQTSLLPGRDFQNTP